MVLNMFVKFLVVLDSRNIIFHVAMQCNNDHGGNSISGSTSIHFRSAHMYILQIMASGIFLRLESLNEIQQEVFVVQKLVKLMETFTQLVVLLQREKLRLRSMKQNHSSQIDAG